MVGFAQASKLDIVSTGSIMHHPNGYEEKRPSFSLDRIVLEKKILLSICPIIIGVYVLTGEICFLWKSLKA